MSLDQIIAPLKQPITLQKAKAQCRCQHDLEDDLFVEWIDGATNYAESCIHRQLITATWKLTLDAFPQESIELKKTPVQAIESVQYFDVNDGLQSLSSDSWFLEGDEVSAWLVPAISWPSTAERPDAVQITFRCGYGNEPANIPACIRNALLIHTEAHFLRKPWDEKIMVCVTRLLRQKTSWRYT